MITIGISTKLYMGPVRTRSWLTDVFDIAASHRGVTSGAVSVFVAPTAPSLSFAVEHAPEGVVVAAQDVSRFAEGAYTGEVGAPFLAELGVRMAEIGHAERRRLFGETDEVVAEKVALAQASGITPLLCVGELSAGATSAAAAFCVEQAAVAASGPVLIAYEPVWAIGAPAPAPASYVREVVAGIKAELPAHLQGSGVVYGGSAGPGLLASLRPEVDGLFLGRFAHDPANVRAVLDEAAALT